MDKQLTDMLRAALWGIVMKVARWPRQHISIVPRYAGGDFDHYEVAVNENSSEDGTITRQFHATAEEAIAAAIKLGADIKSAQNI